MKTNVFFVGVSVVFFAFDVVFAHTISFKPYQLLQEVLILMEVYTSEGYNNQKLLSGFHLKQTGPYVVQLPN